MNKDEKAKVLKKEYGLETCKKCGSFIFDVEKINKTDSDYEKCSFCDIQANKVVIKL